MVCRGRSSSIHPTVRRRSNSDHRCGRKKLMDFPMSDEATLEVLRHAATWFESDLDGIAPLLNQVGDAELVLVGEASHGTHEFYRIRAELTKALILKKGFNAVAVEADWPDAYRAN